MYTSVLILALSGLAPTGETANAPSWLTDYSTANKQAALAGKPLAIFLASGTDGWQKLAGEAGLSNAAKRILSSEYVCLHVDTATEDGKYLAKELAIPTGLGIVISDRTGGLKAFQHEGDLTNADLVLSLQRYADPQYVVRRTETNPGEQFSYYYGPTAGYGVSGSYSINGGYTSGQC